MKSITEKLKEHQEKFTKYTLNELFQDINRAKKYTIKFGDIYFDFSKNFITHDTINLLFQLAEERKLKEKIENMFSGEKNNFTEKRAVLHTALRNFSNKSIIVDEKDIMPEVHQVRTQMKDFVGKIVSGELKGTFGDKIEYVINIGIGGSHLGPAMVVNALKHYNETGLKVYFVSNIDSEDLFSILQKVELQKTLFIIASKTFTTLETMRNAQSAKKWFLENLKVEETEISKHFVALSTNIEECQKFGIPQENIFGFWDWVGGRFSLWSSIGLSIALSVGWNNFEELLRGAYDADRHFRSVPFSENIPIIYGLLTVWYSSFWGWNSTAVIPYSHLLAMFPSFLQQLQMESNGKSINAENNKVEYKTGQIIFGEAGTNSQHSFFQLLHQGTDTIPVDLIGIVEQENEVEDHQKWLLSNMIAQTEALMKGKSESQVIFELENAGMKYDEINLIKKHKIFEGNRPSNIFLIDKLTPHSLGKLIAIYEHKVFVEGVIWEINSFDQWGVELGKQLAVNIYSEIGIEAEVTSHDSSTNNLVNYINAKRS
jgi:glucose-6-phosphate isomerase